MRLARTYSTVSLSSPRAGGPVQVLELRRAGSLNSMDARFFREFAAAAREAGRRGGGGGALVVAGAPASRAFSAGLDVGGEARAEGEGEGEDHMGLLLPRSGDATDPATHALRLRGMLREYQDAFNALEEIPQPVIAVVHGLCLGSGMDLICAADVRFATRDAVFSVAEVTVGLAADLGTLQRLERVVGSSSLAREWAFTGRRFDAATAERAGLVSRVLDTREEALAQAIALGEEIAKHNPVAVHGTKVNLNFARGRPVSEALEYQTTWSSTFLQSHVMRKIVQGVRDRLKRR